MKDERLEILKMLQEGVISVEEAEKLLSAMNDGEQKNREKEQRGPRAGKAYGPGFGHSHGHGPGGNRRRGFNENYFCGEFFTDFDKGFANFGKAMGDIFGGLSDRGRFRDFETVSHMGNNIIPREGDRLEISQQSKGFFKGGCDISLVPSGDEALYLDPRSENSYEILRKGNVLAILCSDDCEISIPAGLEEVSVHLFNGGMEALNLDMPINLETFNGDIDVRNCARPGQLKTVSGDIETSLKKDCKGKMEINTVSGDIRLFLDRTFSGTVESRTISGDINCLVKENVTSRRDSGDFQSSVIYTINGGDEDNKVRCKTVSGNVEIENYADTD